MLLAAERTGQPFLVYRDGAGEQQIRALPAGPARVAIGRADSCDIVIGWDERVSRSHAELVPLGGEWTMVDDGLSRNGTFINGERIVGRRRLVDRDVIQIGRSRMLFRSPSPGGTPSTAGVENWLPPPSLTDTQRRVLEALCAPCLVTEGYSTPASNDAIAAELHLSVDAVKGHMRILFRKFQVGELPQNRKRMRLVQIAHEQGLVMRPGHGPRR